MDVLSEQLKTVSLGTPWNKHMQEQNQNKEVKNFN